jgi:hypothetical protein
MCGTKSASSSRTRREPVVHRGGIRVEIDEEEAVEDLGAHFGQADFAFVEARHHLDVGAERKLAGQLIGPGVVGADHDLAVALARDQLCARCWQTL